MLLSRCPSVPSKNEGQNTNHHKVSVKCLEYPERATERLQEVASLNSLSKIEIVLIKLGYLA